MPNNFLSIDKSFIIKELERELFHNPAVLDASKDDIIQVPAERHEEVLHDLVTIFLRVVNAGTRDLT